MQEFTPLQAIIGVDRKNPHFTLSRSRDYPGKLLVFFGTALLEIVEDDSHHASFKLLLARLYNAGLKPKNLVDAFQVPYGTLRRWGAVLKTGDADGLTRMLLGRQHPRKLTAEIKSFTKRRFSDIYPQDSYTYSQQIRAEILEIFDVTISAETLRPLFTQYRQDLAQAYAGNGEVDDRLVDAAQPVTSRNDDGQDSENDHVVAQGDHESPANGPIETTNRKHMVVATATDAVLVDPNGARYQFYHHAGVLLFSSYLNQLSKELDVGAQLVKQWLSTILSGAVNIEQSKLLNWQALRTFLGTVVVNLAQQRRHLGHLAVSDCLQQLMRLNGQWVGIDQCEDFYYDPHSKLYTGAYKILKGWCSRIRFAEKVLHMDFIHTSKGYPVFIHHDDNFHDLRQRFFDVMTAFRQQFDFGPSRRLLMILDRGIYSLEVFERIIAEDTQTYFVTWEKGYEGDLDTPLNWSGSCQLCKERNSSEDLRLYRFQYHDGDWRRSTSIRCLIVRATNPKGKTIQLSILTNDRVRPAPELIELMFKRWLQENDFKYLDTHFGINEITSYGVIPYQELMQTIEDKQMKSGVYKALEKQRTPIRNKLRSRLLAQHRSNKDDCRRTQAIEKLTQELEQIEAEMKQTNKEVSRLDELVDQQFSKLDTQKKTLMDGIKIIARNLFYLSLQPFKEAYDNHRDDHVLFRHLTRSPGLIQRKGDVVEVLLFPQAPFSPKVAGIIDEILDQMNGTGMEMPDGSGHTIHFRLLRNDQILFALM